MRLGVTNCSFRTGVKCWCGACEAAAPTFIITFAAAALLAPAPAPAVAPAEAEAEAVVVAEAGGSALAKRGVGGRLARDDGRGRGLAATNALCSASRSACAVRGVALNESVKEEAEEVVRLSAFWSSSNSANKLQRLFGVDTKQQVMRGGVVFACEGADRLSLSSCSVEWPGAGTGPARENSALWSSASCSAISARCSSAHAPPTHPPAITPPHQHHSFSDEFITSHRTSPHIPSHRLPSHTHTHTHTAPPNRTYQSCF